MAKKGSEIVAAAQARNKEAGGGRLTMNLTPAENDEWLLLLTCFPPGRGQQKAALMAAIRAAISSDNKRLTRAALLAEIERRLK